MRITGCEAHPEAHPVLHIPLAPYFTSFTPRASHPSRPVLHIPHTPCFTSLSPRASHPSHPVLHIPLAPCFTSLSPRVSHPSHPVLHIPLGTSPKFHFIVNVLLLLSGILWGTVLVMSEPEAAHNDIPCAPIPIPCDHIPYTL